MMIRGLQNIKVAVLAVMTLLFVMSVSSVSARNPRRKPVQTSLLKDPKMYVGKQSWIYTYQFFPTLDGRLVDSSKVHKPVPFMHHRFSFFAEGGRAGFRSNSKDVHFDMINGFGVGANYSYYFTPYFGMKTGFDFVRTTSNSRIGAFSDEYSIVDSEMDETVYKYSVGAVTEHYTHYQIEFPIMLSFKENNFDCGLGLKVGVPVDVDYDQKSDDVFQTAYYPAYDVTVDDSWVLGCGNFNAVSQASSFKQTPVFVMFTADAQYTFPLKNKKSIGVGLFVDYAFLGISAKQSQDKHFKNVDTYESKTMLTVSKTVPVEIVSESILSSRNNSKNQKLVSNMLFMNFGLKVTFNINYGADEW